MPYGQTFEEVSKVHRPAALEKSYGHAINAISEDVFALKQFFIKKGKAKRLLLHRNAECELYVTKGEIVLRVVTLQGEKVNLSLKAGEHFPIAKGQIYGMFGKHDAFVYAFYDKDPDKDKDVVYAETQAEADAIVDVPLTNHATVKAEKTFNFLDKYWGTIESAVAKDYAGKRIFVKKWIGPNPPQGSLEYHVHKTEAYFIESGIVKVGLRIGRAENKSVTLHPGDTFVIRPGTMHCRIGIEDCTIIEISTKDDDADSHLVEDGNKYVHKES